MRTIYCDGSCIRNPGPGGWACLNTESDTIVSGGVSRTTNQQMELMAAIEAIKNFGTPDEEICIMTDSMYVMRGITEWITGWKLNGWKTSKNKPIANLELWKELDLEVLKITVKFEWVRAHNRNPHNDKVDYAARSEAKKLIYKDNIHVSTRETEKIIT